MPPAIETDAEIIKFGGKLLAFSIDDFSEGEDYFSSQNPYLLGWNLAVATISDLLAVGATPMFFSHSFTAAHNFEAPMVRGIAKGIRDVMLECNSHFIGGDVGVADRWHYTGAAIGQVKKQHLMRRDRLSSGETIFISGDVGHGNRAALLALMAKSDGEKVTSRFPDSFFTPTFECRVTESAFIRGKSSTCIDTSDGVIRSLEILSQMNRKAIIIDLKSVPFCQVRKNVTDAFKIPHQLLAFGGAGEYELLFSAAKLEASAYPFTPIALATEGEGIYLVPKEYDFESCREKVLKGEMADNMGLIKLEQKRIDPRQYSDHRQYMLKMIEYFNQIGL